MDKQTLVIAILATAIAGAISWWYRPTQDAPTTGLTPPQGPTQRPITPQPDRQMVWVQVSGAVRHPQSVQLAKGARVRDAIEQAGGIIPGADTAGINWVGKVRDGQRITVPYHATQTQQPKSKKTLRRPASVPIDINTATRQQLMQTVGLSSAQARQVLAYRQRYGEIRDEWELQRVIATAPIQGWQAHPR